MQIKTSLAEAASTLQVLQWHSYSTAANPLCCSVGTCYSNGRGFSIAVVKTAP